MDNFNWLASRGKSRNSMIDIVSGAGYVALNSGYTKYQMFDMNPLNQASFDSNGGTATVLITIDYGVTAMPTNFIAIMNHNLKSADGKIRVAHDTSPIVAVSGGTTARWKDKGCTRHLAYCRGFWWDYGLSGRGAKWRC